MNDAIIALATVVLVGVTAWYAAITRGMAKTARDTAADSVKATAAAERASEAARDAAQVAQSQVRVEFTGRMVAAHTGGSGWETALVLQSIADAVVVREVRVRRAFRESQENELDVKSELVGEVLTPFNEESGLPKRLHQDEDLVLTHEKLQEQGIDPFKSFIIDVEYTFAETGTAGGTRRLIVSRK